MRNFIFLAALPAIWVEAFSFNAYDLGLHGIYPRQHFHSVDYQPPKPKITQWDDRCDNGNLFLTPRGPSVYGAARGPVILDARGNMMWMDNDEFEQALNLNVQKYKGKDYLTFWTKAKKHSKKQLEDMHGHKKLPKKSYVMVRTILILILRECPFRWK